MKPFVILLASLLIAASRLTAAPLVSPHAQTIVNRVNAAYLGLTGWTATIVYDQIIVEGGVTTSTSSQTTERYLKSGGPLDYYSATNLRRNDIGGWTKCQDLAVQRFVFRHSRGSGGELSPADELNRPGFWGDFVRSYKEADDINWAGQEVVAGRNCDILEVTFQQRTSPDDPQAVTRVRRFRYFVNPTGLFERVTMVMEDKVRAVGSYYDARITNDAHAQLTPADFSAESFARDAALVMGGEPMPVLEEKVFAAGGSLPDLTFTGWADGKPFKVSDLKGKVVVLETWASWCHFCKEAFPFYEKMRKALAEQDVVFVAVSFDQKQADYEKWMKQHGGDYGFKFGRVDSPDPKKAMKEFRGSLPAFYVLGRDGRIVSSYLGYGYGSGGEDPRLLAALRAAGIKI
jgi:thiol-disulfide isomerase/thioredoxin